MTDYDFPPIEFPGAEEYTIDFLALVDGLTDYASIAGYYLQYWMFMPIMKFPDPIQGWDHIMYLRLGHIFMIGFLIAIIQYVNRTWRA